MSIVNIKNNNKVVSVTVLVLCLLFSLFIWHRSAESEKKNFQSEFNNLALSFVTEFENSFEKYMEAQNTCIGLFAASKKVERSEWQEFIKALDIEERYPGIQGLGYVAKVLNSNKTSFEQKQSLDDFPGYRIKPVGYREEYWPISFYESINDDNDDIGFDISVVENYYITAKNSMDLAQSMSTIKALSDKSDYLFVNYTPLYHKDINLEAKVERREKIQGWIFSELLIKEFIDSIYKNDDRFSENDFAIKLIREMDSGETVELFASKGLNADEDNFIHRIRLALFGQNLVFEVYASKQYMNSSKDSKSLLILFLGFLISIMIFLILTNAARTQEEAENLAKEMTKELQTKTQELERSNHDLEQFAYITSHDLQEPLRTVGTFVELLIRDIKNRGFELDEKTDKYTTYITEGIHRMKSLIKDVLYYSRVGRYGELERVDLNETLADVQVILSERIAETKAKIVLKNPLPVVNSNATEMQQLFQNMISNAIKYMKPGVEPEVTIACREISSNEYEVMVADNGIGIDSEYHEKIFLMFQRLSNENTYEGTGVGLTLCKRIIENYGGKIWLESKLGEGAKFFFTLVNQA